MNKKFQPLSTQQHSLI